MIFYSIDVRHSRQSDYSLRVLFPEGGNLGLPQETIMTRISLRELFLPMGLLTRFALCPRSRVKRPHPAFVIATTSCHWISLQGLLGDLILILSPRAYLAKRSSPYSVIASFICEAISFCFRHREPTLRSDLTLILSSRAYIAKRSHSDSVIASLPREAISTTQ